MKASELMQGNIVMYEYDGEKIQARVVEIYRSSVLVESVSGEYEPIEIDETKIYPIEITPEILEKNGFKKDTGEDEECWACKIGWFTPHKYNKKFIPVSWEVEICGKPNSFDGVIKFVHELQHCFKLVGIKKDIVL